SADYFINKRVRALNMQVMAIAAEKSLPGSPVLVVDQYTGFDPMADTYDGQHPNASGEDKMAAVWFAALQSVWDGPAPPAPPTGLRATAANAQVELSWAGSLGAISYIIKRSTTSGAGYVSIGTNDTTTFMDSGLANNTSYFYVVSAVSAQGQSSYSVEARA